MSLQITGKVIEILEEKSGEGKNGTWRKQEFVLEIPGQDPTPVFLMVWGDKIDKFGVKDGETLTAHIDIQSREFNGKWYTDVKAWRVERKAGGEGSVPPAGGDEPSSKDAPSPSPPKTSPRRIKNVLKTYAAWLYLDEVRLLKDFLEQIRKKGSLSQKQVATFDQIEKRAEERKNPPIRLVPG